MSHRLGVPSPSAPSNTSSPGSAGPSSPASSPRNRGWGGGVPVDVGDSDEEEDPLAAEDDIVAPPQPVPSPIASGAQSLSPFPSPSGGTRAELSDDSRSIMSSSTSTGDDDYGEVQVQAVQVRSAVGKAVAAAYTPRRLNSASTVASLARKFGEQSPLPSPSGKSPLPSPSARIARSGDVPVNASPTTTLSSLGADSRASREGRSSGDAEEDDAQYALASPLRGAGHAVPLIGAPRPGQQPAEPTENGAPARPVVLPLAALPLFRSPADVPFSPDQPSPQSAYTTRSAYSGIGGSAATRTARTSAGFSIPSLSAMLPTPTPVQSISEQSGADGAGPGPQRESGRLSPAVEESAESHPAPPRSPSPSASIASSSNRAAAESPTPSSSDTHAEHNLRARRLKAKAAKLEAEGKQVPGGLMGDLGPISTGPIVRPPRREAAVVQQGEGSRERERREEKEEAERIAKAQRDEVVAQRKERQREREKAEAEAAQERARAADAERERDRQRALILEQRRQHEAGAEQTPASGEFREEVNDEWTHADDNTDDQSGYASSDTHGIGIGGGVGNTASTSSSLAKRSASFIRGMLPSRPSSAASGHFGVGASMQRPSSAASGHFGVGASMQRPSSAASNHSTRSTRSNRSATFFGIGGAGKDPAPHRRPSIDDIRRSVVIPNEDGASGSSGAGLGHRRDTSFEVPRRAPLPPKRANSGELAVPSNPFEERPGSAASMGSNSSVDSSGALRLARSAANLRSTSVTPRLPPAAPPPAGPPPARPVEQAGASSPAASARRAAPLPPTPVTARLPSPTVAKPTPIRVAAPAPPPSLALPPIPSVALGRFSFEKPEGLAMLSASADPADKGSTDSGPPSRTPSRGASSLAAPAQTARGQSASSEDLRLERSASSDDGPPRRSLDTSTRPTRRFGSNGNGHANAASAQQHVDSPARSTTEPVEDLAEGSAAQRFSAISSLEGHGAHHRGSSEKAPPSPADSIRSGGSGSVAAPGRFLSASSNAGSSSGHKGSSGGLAPSTNGSWDAYRHSNASASSAVSSLQIHGGAEQRSSTHSAASSSATGPRFSSGSAGTFGSSVSVSVGGRNTNATGTPRSSLGHGTDGGRLPPSASPRAELVQIGANSSSVRSMSRPASPSSPGLYSSGGAAPAHHVSSSTTTTPTPQTGPIPGSMPLAPGMTLIEDDIEYEETREMPEPSSLYGIRRRLVSTFPTLGGKSNVIRPLSALRSVSRTSLHHTTDDEGDPDADAYEQWEQKRKGAVLMGEKAIRKAEEKLEAREKNLSIEALSKQEVATVSISVYTEQRDGRWVVRGPAGRGIPPQDELPHVGDPWATPIDSKGIVARRKLKSNVELTTTRTVVRCPDCTVPPQQLSSFTSSASPPPAPKVPPGQHCHTCSSMRAIETVWVVTVTLRVATFQPLKLPASHLLGTRQPHLRYIEATDAEHRDAVLRDRAIDGTLTAASRVGRQHAQMHGARLLMARARVDRRIVLSVAVTNARTKARRTFDVVDGPEGKVSETTMAAGASGSQGRPLRKSSSASSALADYNPRAGSQLELSHESDGWRSAVSLAGTVNGGESTRQRDKSSTGSGFARVGQFGRKSSAGHVSSGETPANGATHEYTNMHKNSLAGSSSEGRPYGAGGLSSNPSSTSLGDRKGRLRGLFKS